MRKLLTIASLTVCYLGCALTLVGCNKDPLDIYLAAGGDGGSPDEDAQLAPDGTGGRTDGPGPTGDACLATAEVCDGKDNDCNGVVDDVDPGYLAADANNCGACGKACSFPSAFGECNEGKCQIKECAPGHYDVNGKADDGCEYQCVESNGGQEECPVTEPDCACDGADNDCDGEVDEVFDTSSDLNNCGACGARCLYSNAVASCSGGKCQMLGCLEGFADLNKKEKDGCEYGCPVWPAATGDDCDGVDNDCDGKVDEDLAVTACGIDVGECQVGSNVCVGGKIVCQGSVGPSAELCNNLDDDCDGTVDNGFDKQNDPRYCGASCTKCTFAHALAKCVAGSCAIAVCEQGWINLNNQPGDGCEYECTVTGPEICDGIDNDCDGKIDTADSDMVALSVNPCLSVGPCAGATASCQGDLGWVCSYGGDVQLRSCSNDSDCFTVKCVGGKCPGIVALEESLCDDKDNDCDGQTDEFFPNKDLPCAESGKQGICQGTGAFVCRPDKADTVCEISTTGKTPTDEECNGLDDDCDGNVDEEDDDASFDGVKDEMILVTPASGPAFYIYTYEASRPDADGATAGSLGSRACSKGNVLPWADVNYATAEAACAAAGKRLCTPAEWLAACAGDPATVYPYGDTHVSTTCNGLENLQGKALVTGAKAGCVSADGVYDMSGNLREWTDDPVSDGSAPDPDAYTVRGGGFDTPQPGQKCGETFVVMPPLFAFPNLGFRCCSDTGP